jgi:hypothetical protein
LVPGNWAGEAAKTLENRGPITRYNRRYADSSPSTATIATMPAARPLSTALLILALSPPGGGAVRGDVLELTGGGRVEGRIVESQSDEKSSYVVELAVGGKLKIPRSVVARVDASSPAQQEYDRIVRNSPDTVDAHWKLAEWCRDHKLRELSQRHLNRILELEPNHEEARTLLGFRNAGGQWRTREQVMADRGMVKYDGRYVTRQHVELLERNKQTDASTGDWKKELDRLRRALTGRSAERAEQAHAEVLAIRDPLAAEPVIQLIRRENDPQLKRLWIDVAAGLDSQAALDTLVNLSLLDPDPEIREACLDHVIRSGKAGIANVYIRALKNRDNELINRAGAALGLVGDREAIGPLIDALVTKHRVQVSGGSNPDQHAYTMVEGGGFTFGNAPAKFENRAVRNPDVLASLVKLAGISFDYDQPQWRTWLAAQAKLHAVDVRRDE